MAWPLGMQTTVTRQVGKKKNREKGKNGGKEEKERNEEHNI